MFCNKDKSKKRAEELQEKIYGLEETIKTLKEQLGDLKLKKKIEEEDIKHMVRIKQEALEIEHQKKELKLQKQSDDIIAAVKDEYRDRLEGFLQKQVQDVKEMYGQILKRLPDVNVRLKGDV